MIPKCESCVAKSPFLSVFADTPPSERRTHLKFGKEGCDLASGYIQNIKGRYKADTGSESGETVRGSDSGETVRGSDSDTTERGLPQR